MKHFLRMTAIFVLLLISVCTIAQPPVKEIYPDLAISDFRITSITSQQVKYTCTVTNIGEQMATIPTGVGLQVRFFASLENAQKNLSGVNLAGGGTSLGVGSLNKGESVTRTFMMTGDRTAYKLCSVILDEFKKVSGESNTANNTRFAIVPLP